MKNIFLFIAETCLLAIMLYFAIINQMTESLGSFTFLLQENSITVSIPFLIIFFYFIGLFSGLVYSVIMTGVYKGQLAQYSKKTEKLLVQKESDSDDIETLKRKVQTLETALDKVLKNNKEQ